MLHISVIACKYKLLDKRIRESAMVANTNTHIVHDLIKSQHLFVNRNI